MAFIIGLLITAFWLTILCFNVIFLANVIDQHDTVDIIWSALMVFMASFFLFMDLLETVAEKLR